jgi:thiamine-phosphate pyrophosphorylase
MAGRPARAVPRLIGISSGDHRAGRDLVSMLAAAARGGLPAVILREPQLSARELVALARRLAPAFGPGLVLHGRHPDALALAAAGGFGLHLPAGVDAGAARARTAGLLGQSCHGPEELAAAARAGCDYALLSPIFAPHSKPADPRRPLGIDGLARACADPPLPVLALGGLDPERARGCLEAGAHGVAALGGLWPPDATPEQVEGAARAFLAALEGARVRRAPAPG